MQVIGPDPGISIDDDAVHTIDLWFSQERRQWVVQRLNGHGDQIGHSHFCRTENEARACVADWMRRHPATHLTTPRKDRSVGAGRSASGKSART